MSLFCLYKNVGFCRGNKPRVSKAFVAFWDKVYKLKHKGDKVMKKYLLLGASLIVASSAYAEFDCTKIPTCADLGFTMSTTDCQGKQILRCPREPDNDNRVFCGGCKVGAVLCDDLQCYDADNIPSDKTPIAVVFDSANRLAIGLNDAPSTMGWASTKNDTPLPNYTTEEEALAAKETGKENTATIVALGEDYASSKYASGYCYNLTEGNQPEGSWFLPSLKELKLLCNNKDSVNYSILHVGGSSISTSYRWTSTESSPQNAWRLSIFSCKADGFNDNNYLYKSFVRCAIQY